MLHLKDCYKVCQLKSEGSAPVPQEGEFSKITEIKHINGFSHGCGACAPQQGVCKLTLNVKKGVIEEALIETVGCSGMTHSAAMAAEVLPGKTLLEAFNTDLVCDAINVALRELALQLMYGRSQSAFSLGGLEVGAGLEDLGKHLASQVGTSYATRSKGVRYLQMTEGYVTRLALDKNNEVIGYEYVNTDGMMNDIMDGKDAAESLKKFTKTFGRFGDAVKTINPRRK